MTCERKGKWIGGCNFEPRYHTTPPDVELLPWEMRVGLDVAKNIQALTKETYVCDACTRCGKRAEKQ